MACVHTIAAPARHNTLASTDWAVVITVNQGINIYRAVLVDFEGKFVVGMDTLCLAVLVVFPMDLFFGGIRAVVLVVEGDETVSASFCKVRELINRVALLELICKVSQFASLG